MNRVSEPLPESGLCATCLRRRDVVTARSSFVFCTKSQTDPAFPKYPRLPVLTCAGYEPRPGADAAPARPRQPG